MDSGEPRDAAVSQLPAAVITEPGVPAPTDAQELARPEPVPAENPVPDPAPTVRTVDLRDQPIRDPVIQGDWIKVDRAYPPLDFRLFDQEIADVVSLIAESAGQNIVLSDETEVRTKRITAEIRNQPWHIALEALLSAHGLRAIQDGRTGIITVVTAERARVDRRTYPIRLRYLYARDLLPSVERILAANDSTEDGAEVYGDPESSRTIVAFASPDQLAEVQALVDSLDVQPARVSVEIGMHHINRSTMQDLGFSFSLVPIDGDSEGTTGVQVRTAGNPGSRGLSGDNGPAFQVLRQISSLGTVGLNTFIDAISEVGLAETETREHILTNSGGTSYVKIGDAFILPNNQPILYGGGVVSGFQPGMGQPGQNPYGQPNGNYGSIGQQQIPGQYGNPGAYGGGVIGSGGFATFETGTQLTVTPYVIEGGEQVTMTLDLVRDGGTLSPDGQSITGGKQSLFTEATVATDVTMVIGGLTVNGRARTTSGVPGLSDLPVVGRIFRREEVSTNYQDLIITVTPHVHQEEGPRAF